MIKDFVAVDIETTGLSPADSRIIEIGAARYQNGTEIEAFQVLINPFVPLSQKIIELTGIVDEMLIGAKTEEEGIKEFLDFLKKDVILGHNILFDYSFLKIAAQRYGLSFACEGIDTLALCKKYHKEAEKRSLEAMCLCYQIKNETAHRALSDARASASLYFKLGEQFSHGEDFLASPLLFKVKKSSVATEKQKKYLLDLVKYHKIELLENPDQMTKSEASTKIDQIISTYGNKR